jgi:oligoendopeptidase F
MPARREVPVEQTWDLAHIFATTQDWEAGLAELGTLIPELAACNGRLAAGSAPLLAYLRASETASRLALRLFVYAMLAQSSDTTDQAAIARVGQARGAFARLRAATAFSDPELMAIGFDRLREWMQTAPDLQLYAHYFERLEKRQPYVRSPEVEQVMALTGEAMSAPGSIYDSLTDADMKFKPARSSAGAELEVGQGTIDSLLHSADRETRRTAFENYSDGYLSFKNTLTGALTGAVHTDVFRMRARGYASSLEASLTPNLIPVEVFHNLIATFKKHLPTWHRYWDVRRRMLGYDQLHWYDTVAPMTSGAPTVTFQQGVEWIAAGMRPLGDDYVADLRRGCLEERWVDYAINKGKAQGAFSSGTYDTPPYILMSWSDDVFSLSTLAHELGHSMHSYYTRRAQPYVYAGYSLFVAEVASNFNQAMTRAYLFENNPARDFQIALIDEAMSNYRRYFFIMPTLARFELEMHARIENGKPVNADILIGLCADLFQEGFGDTMVFDRERMGIKWAEFGHLYANFYVYQYATGIAAAAALAQGVRADASGAAAKRYRDFLAAGGSMYPLDALKLAGIDMTTPEPVEKAFNELAGIVDRLESLLDG